MLYWNLPMQHESSTEIDLSSFSQKLISLWLIWEGSTGEGTLVLDSKSIPFDKRWLPDLSNKVTSIVLSPSSGACTATWNLVPANISIFFVTRNKTVWMVSFCSMANLICSGTFLENCAYNALVLAVNAGEQSSGQSGSLPSKPKWVEEVTNVKFVPNNRVLPTILAIWDFSQQGSPKLLELI